MKILLYSLTIIALIFSCKDPGSEEDTVLKYVAGLVVDNEMVKNDSLISYSYFLPSNYDTTKWYPAILFFDAHARGKLPVKKYHSLAEQYGYILIGSNNSRNGISQQDYLNIYSKTFVDITHKFKINKERIYTSGFSGGARVASGLAIWKGGVEGVIACGAGFPQINTPIAKNFKFISIVGEEDFNFVELKLLSAQLDTLEARNDIITFPGKHDWPPDSVMQKAFFWLETNAMQDGKKPKDDQIINEIYKYITNDYDSSGTDLESLLRASRCIKYLNQLQNIEVYINHFALLQDRENIKIQTENELDQLKEERQKQQEYIQFLSTKDYSWWQDEINRLHKATDVRSKRFLNYISLLLNMNINGMIENNMLQEAYTISGLYKLADPENPDVYYLSACIYAMSGEVEKAEQSLQLSIQYGFEDKAKIIADKRLDVIKDKEIYQKYISGE